MVLCYHGVREGWDPGISALPAQRLERHVDYLFGRGFRPALPERGSHDSHALAVTLDDGLCSQIEDWAQPLAERGLQATLFVPSAYVGEAARWDFAARRRRHASWSQLSDWCALGHAVGAHGHTHRDLRRLSDHELERETAGSRQHLEDRLTRPVTAFAYPFGRFNSRVVQAVRSAGYTHAFTTEPQSLPADPFRLPRLVVSWFDTELSLEARSGNSAWGAVERGKQRLINFWSGGTSLYQSIASHREVAA